MERRFDLREASDRRELASYLPNVDGRTIQVPPREFEASLHSLSTHLGEPDWLTYQFGVVGPLRNGNEQQPLDLAKTLELGLDLRELSGRDNFAALLEGFHNPPQFTATMFEAHSASFFSRLQTTRGLRFSPQRQTRGHDKRPDFEVYNEIGDFLVECKRPHMMVQRAVNTFGAIATALKTELERQGWPREARLEVEIVSALKDNPARFAAHLVARSVEAWNSGVTGVQVDGAHAYVCRRNDAFHINDPKFGHDVMVLDTSEATGLFNPTYTMLRVGHNGLDHKFARSIGARLAEAIRQLPSDEDAMILLGDVPKRIADAAIDRRIGDSAYDGILAFVVHEGDSDQFHFSHRPSRRGQIQKLVASGTRPLFTS